MSLTYSFLKHLENKYIDELTGDYLTGTKLIDNSQSISEADREEVVIWLRCITKDSGSSLLCYYLSVSIMDRYLYNTIKYGFIKPDDLKRIAAASHFIASKYCGAEIYSDSYQKFSNNMYTSSAIVHQEDDILSFLKFRLMAPTAATFIYGLNDYEFDQFLLDYKLSRTKPSIYAKALLIIYSTNKGYGNENKPKQPVLISSIEINEDDLPEIKSCVINMIDFLKRKDTHDKVNERNKQFLQQYNVEYINYDYLKLVKKKQIEDGFQNAPKNIVSNNSKQKEYAKSLDYYCKNGFWPWNIVEIAILSEINQTYIVNFYRVDGYFMIEECLDINLTQYKLNNTLCFKDIFKVVYQLTKALEYLHSISISHCDIKPDNIMVKLDDKKSIDYIKLIDFGISAHLIHPNRCIATFAYRPPEVVFNKTTSNDYKYTTAVDIWALGCVIAFLALKDDNNLNYIASPQRCVREFKTKNHIKIPTNGFSNMCLATVIGKFIDDIDNQIKNYRYTEYPDWIYNLMKRCLSLNPNNRPTATEILELFSQLLC
jgi:hypothetical protein